MYQALVWLCILAPVLQIGNCYVVKDGDILSNKVDTTRTCSLSELHLNPTENVLQCFPEKDTEGQGFVEDGTTCVISQDVQIKHAPDRNEIALRQCVHGRWTVTDLGVKRHIHKRFWGFVAAAVACYYLCSSGNGQGQTVYVTKTPPRFRDDPCTPPNLNDAYYVDSGQTSTVVTWSAPVAEDDDGNVESVQQIQGQSSGSQFEGLSGSGQPHYITYRATDNDGLTATCYFHFTVILHTCDPAPWPTNGKVDCSHEANLGSVCTYSCILGYEVSGTNQITCQGGSSPEWSTTPTCEKVVCPEPASLEHGNVSCPNAAYEYESVCTFTCDTNYTLSGNIVHIQCKADRTWTSSQYPTCIDAFPPDLNCETPQIVYADRNSSTTTVEWILPTVNDAVDPNPEITQTDGQAHGSVFSSGSSFVKYKATDSQGNESPECTIELRVIETTCPHPLDTLQDTNMVYDCKTVTYRYGTECMLSCKSNIPFAGTDRITCEQNASSTNLAVGYWSWGAGDMPFCNHTDCPTPDAPTNGALAVDYIGVNKVVTMFCNANFTVPKLPGGFTGQLFCQNSGLYTPNIDIPDCTEPRGGRAIELPSELYYYTGDCNDAATQEQIKANLQQILATSVNVIIRELCPAVNNCTTSNLHIVCGSTTSRRKRSIRSNSSTNEDGMSSPHDIQKRQNELPTLIATFDIIANIDQSLNTRTALQNVDSLLADVVVPQFESFVADGITFNLDSFTMQLDSFQAPAYGNIVCDEGNILDQTQCVPCPAAYFHNTTSDQCELCPVGTYSEVAGLAGCIPCQSGYTTLETGSKYEGQCIEMCPAGRYSATGTVPCTPCPIGYYQSGTGQTTCTKCTTGTTEMTGSVSTSSCQAFHVLIKDTSEDVTAGSLSVDMTDITLAVWTKLYSAGTADANIRLTSEGTDRVIIHLRDNIRVEIPGTVDISLGSLSSTTWSHVAVTWDTTNNAVVVILNGQVYSTESGVTAPPLPLVSGGAIKLQSTGDTGLYIADLHLEDTVLSPSEIAALMTSCWTERPASVFSLDDLRDINLLGVHLQTPLSCDPIDECTSNPCNDHTCVNGINTYTCYCSGGWSGVNCTTPPDHCLDHGCANGATCVNGNNGYTCTCMAGYSSSLCDLEQVDGGFSDWSNWADCSATCDGGTQIRTRSCDNPVPSPNGVDCSGERSETQICNSTPCPNCPQLSRGYKGSTNCTTDDITGTTTCRLICAAGYALPVNFADEVYTCGISTDYVWSPMDNAPDCVDPNPPSRYRIQTSTEYDSSIADSDVPAVEQAVSDNLSNVTCVTSGKCTASVEVVNSRRKRSTGSTISVTLTVNITETGDLDIQDFIATSTASASLQELIDAINNLETAASYINSSSSSIFDVTVNGITYTSSQSTLTITGNVTCPSGQTATDGVCASCPEGTYYTNGYCTFCEKGTYSSSTGQTSCTACPSGFTTSTIGSYNVSQCTVTVTTSTSATTTPSPTTTASTQLSTTSTGTTSPPATSETPTTTASTQLSTTSTGTTSPPTTSATHTTTASTQLSTTSTGTTSPPTTSATHTTTASTQLSTTSTGTTSPPTTSATHTTTASTQLSTTSTGTTSPPTTSATHTTTASTHLSTTSTGTTSPPATTVTSVSDSGDTHTTSLAATSTEPDTSNTGSTDNKGMYIGIAVAVTLAILIGVSIFVVYYKMGVRKAQRISSARPLCHVHPPPGPKRENSAVSLANVDYRMKTPDLDTYIARPMFTGTHIGNTQVNQRFDGPHNQAFVNTMYTDGDYLKPSVSPPPPYVD